MERVLRWYAFVSTAGAYAASLLLTADPPHALFRLPGFLKLYLTVLRIVVVPLWHTFNLWTLLIYFPVIIGSGIVAGVATLALTSARRDVDTAFWHRIWTGRIGRAVFAIARKLVGKGGQRTAFTHRPTELSLGLAAEELYAHLPKATREALGDMPTALRRLQNAAQVLRVESDRLQEALNDAGGAAMSEDFASVRDTRDQLLARHRDAVAELEALRLGLLRLHAGAVSVESVTTHLRLATEVSEHVERLIAARTEMERELDYPRPAVPSPA